MLLNTYKVSAEYFFERFLVETMDNSKPCFLVCFKSGRTEEFLLGGAANRFADN